MESEQDGDSDSSGSMHGHKQGPVIQPDPMLTLPNTSSKNGSDGAMCTVYTGNVCHAQLQSLQNCIPGREGSQVVYISSDVDQMATEDLVMLVEKGLMHPVLSASTECLDVVDPFLCLYYFGLCDISGNLFEPSEEACIAISTDICQREWSIAENFVTLPSCDTFNSTIISCNGTGLSVANVLPNTTETDSSGDEDMPDVHVNGSCSHVMCRDDFHCVSGICRPRCDKWQSMPEAESVSTDVVVVFSALVGVGAGVLVLVLSCIRRRRMFTFPSIIIVYQTITVLVLGVIVLIAYTDRTELFCSSIDLLDSIDDSTPFCILSGTVFYYVLLQLALWWILHVLILFWKVNFPLHARSFQAAHRSKYIHIACLFVGMLLPLVPVITVFTTSGFGITRFPPLLCTGLEGDPSFYSLVIPLIVLLQIGVTMLLILFWILHKKEGLFRAKQSKTPMKLGTAEKKILIISCYYVLLGVIALTTFTRFVHNGDKLVDEYQKYFLCESKGIDPKNPDQDCDKSGLQDLTPVLSAVSYLLIGIFPVVNLVYALNINEMKVFCRQKLSRIFPRFMVVSSANNRPSSSDATSSSAIK